MVKGFSATQLPMSCASQLGDFFSEGAYLKAWRSLAGQVKLLRTEIKQKIALIKRLWRNHCYFWIT